METLWFYSLERKNWKILSLILNFLRPQTLSLWELTDDPGWQNKHHGLPVTRRWGFLKSQILDGDYNRDSLHSALVSQKQVWAGMERSKDLFKHWSLFPASSLDGVTWKPHLEIQFCTIVYLTRVLLHTLWFALNFSHSLTLASATLSYLPATITRSILGRQELKQIPVWYVHNGVIHI